VPQKHSFYIQGLFLWGLRNGVQREREQGRVLEQKRLLGFPNFELEDWL
jgi:hypothetical protein